MGASGLASIPAAVAASSQHPTDTLPGCVQYIGWMLALWAEFSNPLSGVTLAVGAGIFVQVRKGVSRALADS